MNEALRDLPAVHRVLEEAAVAGYASALGHETIKRAVEQVLDRARACGGQTYESILTAVTGRLDEIRLSGMIPAINATGVMLHTNLGRAPLGVDALAAIERFAGSYSNLEFDLELGERGSRYERVTEAVREATGASAALVVNNCAAAVLLVLDTFAKGREVIVARTQLIEIGGGFRIPEVLERSGAVLVEVGTTNRVYLRDFDRALSPRTAMLLRTHPSNYRIDGFTSDVSGAELVALARRAGATVVEDLGSGALIDLTEYGLPHERTVQEALGDGMDLVTFSGDKLLGGPQAGIIVGKERFVAALRSNPLLRALRVDKLTIAALAATLQCYRDRCSRERIPLYRMLATTLDALRERSKAYLTAVPGAFIVATQAYVGGGALPQVAIASLAISLPTARPDRVAAILRRGVPAVVGRVEEGQLLFDLRTIAPEEDERVIAALVTLAPQR
ncbi:MAG: L-seryl-tRNA(Sec) selenium transferase [Candidatus Eremiobacteraeota bacterium]|nr:L-seryl-tRNA(Sec) selenium transferase [Candidatus Eremiobacteraeota bacterium]